MIDFEKEKLYMRGLFEVKKDALAIKKSLYESLYNEISSETKYDSQYPLKPDFQKIENILPKIKQIQKEISKLNNEISDLSNKLGLDYEKMV